MDTSRLVLTCSGLAKAFGGVKAVEGFTHSFAPGTVTAIIGPNGSGKTSVFNLIGGFITPDNGTVSYGGHTLTGLRPWEIARLGIGRLFQDPRVFGNLTLMDNVLAGCPGRRGVEPLEVLLRWRRVQESERSNRLIARCSLEQVGLARREHEAAELLSHGEQKLLAIARLFAGQSQVLLMDEPAAGLDADRTADMIAIVRQLAEGGGLVIVIEHRLRVVAEIADFVCVMQEGKLIAWGPTRDMLSGTAVQGCFR